MTAQNWGFAGESQSGAASSSINIVHIYLTQAQISLEIISNGLKFFILCALKKILNYSKLFIDLVSGPRVKVFLLLFTD